MLQLKAKNPKFGYGQCELLKMGPFIPAYNIVILK
tara:strand:- start:15073 stop:15177 length:105 start_codon:yes stop_codon:yes gene_type:complete